MLVLAIDSSEKTASAALVCDGKLAAQTTVTNREKDHSSNLLPTVESLMKAAGKEYGDIDCFAVSAGPGSFTGIRIGISTVKGLAFGRGKICVGVSTLEALAYNFTDTDGIICPVMDARRGNLYNAVFRSSGGTITRLTEDRLISASDLAAELNKFSETVYFCGGGYELAAAACRGTVVFAETGQLRRWQSGLGVALAAEEKIKLGETTDDVSLAPVYLRPSSAERLKNGKSSEH